MTPGTRKARGVSRSAGLAIVLVAGLLVAWLLLKCGNSGPVDEAASSRPASSVDAKDTGSPAPAPASALPAQRGNTGTAQTASATAASASSGIGFESIAAAPASSASNSAAAVAGSTTGTSSDANNDANQFPRFWRRCFLDPAAQDDYLIASDSGTAWSGSWSVKIASRTDKPRIAGAGLCQAISAATIQGHRIRVTMHMRTEAAVPGAHMLFRAEGPDGRLLAFYNMEPRWVSGTRDWAEYSAVLDVPAPATVILFGGTLVNTGTLWIDDALIEFVGGDVGVTLGAPTGVHFNPAIDASTLPMALQNPGFEQLLGAPSR